MAYLRAVTATRNILALRLNERDAHWEAAAIPPAEPVTWSPLVNKTLVSSTTALYTTENGKCLHMESVPGANGSILIVHVPTMTTVGLINIFGDATFQVIGIAEPFNPVGMANIPRYEFTAAVGVNRDQITMTLIYANSEDTDILRLKKGERSLSAAYLKRSVIKKIAPGYSNDRKAPASLKTGQVMATQVDEQTTGTTGTYNRAINSPNDRSVASDNDESDYESVAGSRWNVSMPIPDHQSNTPEEEKPKSKEENQKRGG